MLKKNLHRYVLGLILAIVTVSSANIQWGGNHWKDIVESDGKGYYAYLPAIFIYHDLNFGFFEKVEKEYYNVNTFYDYRTKHKERFADKYYCGSAVAMLPFFLIAHAASLLSGMPADGYSKLYPVSVNIAAIFYLLAGLIFLRKILMKYHDDERLISFILLAVTFGTNLFYYTVCEPAMSHIYSFFFIHVFVLNIILFIEEKRFRWLLLASLSLGIIALIRPVNLLVIIAIPFITGSKEKLVETFQFLFRKTLWWIASIGILLLIVFIQNIIYKIQVGEFFIDSYPGEKFNWMNPQLLNILFSYKKGLFVYTPLLFLSLAGFIYLFRKEKFRFYSLLAFLAIITYVFSSWWCWYYGGGFGVRPYVEYSFAFAILLLYALKMIQKKLLKSIFVSLVILLVCFCQVQTYQYRYYFIHWSNMDKEHYWRVFMRIDLMIKNENLNKDLLN